jgi:hypothetical protein
LRARREMMGIAEGGDQGQGRRQKRKVIGRLLCVDGSDVSASVKPLVQRNFIGGRK